MTSSCIPVTGTKAGFLNFAGVFLIRFALNMRRRG